MISENDTANNGKNVSVEYQNDGADLVAHNWMSNLPEHLTKIPLNQLCIPGSHDSFSHQIADSYKQLGGARFGSDLRPSSRTLIGWLRSLGTRILLPWIVTQSCDAARQLASGIRYFDLRVSLDVTTSHTDATAGLNPPPPSPHSPPPPPASMDQLWITHQLLSCPLRACLEQISGFLQANPREVVLLDFHHVYLAGSPSHWRVLRRFLLDTFADKLVPPPPPPHLLVSPDSCRVPSLVELWALKRQVIIFMPEPPGWECRTDEQKKNNDEKVDEDDEVEREARLKFWPKSSLQSDWANTAQPHELQRFLRVQMAERGNTNGNDIISSGSGSSNGSASASGSSKSGSVAQFHVAQAILTPNARLIATSPRSSLRSSLAPKAAHELRTLLEHCATRCASFSSSTAERATESLENTERAERVERAMKISPINIVICDFVNDFEFASAVIQHNFVQHAAPLQLA